MQFKANKFIDKTLRLKNYGRNVLNLNEGPVKVYVVTQNTQIEVIENGRNLENNGKLVKYEGIVTNDKLIKSGIFVLDNKVLVVQSTLCVITNVRKVNLGMTVSINNAHVVKKLQSGKIGLLLCAKSRIDSADFAYNSIHSDPEDQKLFEKDEIIQKCLYLTLSSRQILFLADIFFTLEKQLKINLDFEPKFLKFLGLTTEVGTKISLLNDFLCQPHRCSAEMENFEYCTFLRPLKATLEVIKENLNLEPEESQNQKCSLHYNAIMSQNIDNLPQYLIGKVKIIPELGVFQLYDSSGEVIVIFKSETKQIMSETLVKITKFMAVKEEIKVGSLKWHFFYLIISNYEAFCDVEDQNASSLVS